jgi:hypothetical protein
VFFLLPLLASSKIKSSKSKPTTSTKTTAPSSDTVNGKTSTSKVSSESHPRPTSTSSSSTSSRRSSSTHNPNKSSTSSKTIQNSTSTKTPTTTATTTTDSTVLDPLAFAASGGLTFPYFLPSLLSQATSTNTTNPSTNSTGTYPFSSLSSSLLNPAATLYPFLSPDWFTSPSKFMDGYANLTSDKSNGNFYSQIFSVNLFSIFRFQRIFNFTSNSK